MVFVNYKKSEKNSFVIDCPATTRIGEVLEKIIAINNIRMYLDRLIWSVEELANKGVLKPVELQGVSPEDYLKHEKEFVHLSEEIKAYAVKPNVEPPYRYVSDKHNQRYGVILPEQLKTVVLKAVNAAKKAMQPKKDVFNQEQIVAAVEGIRQAVITCYPAYIGLPDWEPTFLLLEEKLTLEVLQSQHYELFGMEATVWWAGNELNQQKTLADYCGKNEKTRIIVKVQKLGGQQPLREPPVDNETYQKMVKFYYKKVEETKQFEKKSVETHYDRLQPGSLKAKVHLEDQEIRFKPL